VFVSVSPVFSVRLGSGFSQEWYRAMGIVVWLLPFAMVVGLLLALDDLQDRDFVGPKVIAIAGGVAALLFDMWAFSANYQSCPCKGMAISVLLIGAILLIVGGALLPREEP
jgi:ammonia channel protein AmtB